MQTTDLRYDGAWHQIGGDISASDESARFARVTDGSIEIVNVDYEPQVNAKLPYYVTEFTYGDNDIIWYSSDDNGLHTNTIAAAIESAGYGPEFIWDSIWLCEALFNYGVCDERQPSTYFDDYGASLPTLRAVMDDYGIPASALWRPSEYDAPAPDDDDSDD